MPRVRETRVSPAHAAAAASRAAGSHDATRGRYAPLAVFAAASLPALAAYLATLAPGLAAGDSGELVTAAWTFGVAHPPGYPLYVLAGGAWAHVLAIGNVAWRLNLFSALAAAAACGVLALAVARASRAPAAGVLAAWAYAFAAPVWKTAVVAEVFAPNALLASLALLALADADDAGAPASRARSRLLALVFLGVLALSLHHTLLLLALPATLAVLPRAWREAAGHRVALVRDAALVELAALVPLAWPHLASFRRDGLVWGDARSWRGFCELLLRADYGSTRLDPAQAGMHADTSHVWLWLRALPHDVGVPVLLLALAGAVVVARTRRTLAIVLAAFLALQALFFTRVGFPSDVAWLAGVVERFYVLPALVLALLAGLGAAALLGALPARTRLASGVALALAIGALGAAGHARVASQRGNTLPEVIGRGVLASLPERAVLFSQGDLVHNALAYLQQVEHERPDVTVLDQELMTYAWYVRQVQSRDPHLLPRLSGAERIELDDGRHLEGWLIPRVDGRVDVLTEHAQGTLSAARVKRVTPLPPEQAFRETRATFRLGWPRDPSDNRYSGLPASRNLVWLDALLPARPVAMIGYKDESFALRDTLTPIGMVAWVTPKASPPAIAAQADAALAMLEQVDLDGYFRSFDPTSFERAERWRVTAAVARTAIVVCRPEAAAAVRAHPEGMRRLRDFASAFEALEPSPAPACLRALAFLHLFDDSSRDLERARRDLERWLASEEPAARRDVEARATLAKLRVVTAP